MSRRGCLSAELAVRFICDALAASERAAVAAHVEGCSRCRKRLELLRRIMAADVGEIDRSLSEAVEATRELLSEPAHRWPLLACEARYRQPDVARRLLAAALEEREHSGWRAAQMALAAAKIADALAMRTDEVTELQFEGWKSASFLLREIGRYDDCARALARAEEIAERVSDVELARAAIWHCRALMCSEPDVWQPNDALTFLDRAEAVYARRDLDRWMRVQTTRGIVLWRMGVLDRASKLLSDVLARTDSRDEIAYADAEARLLLVVLDMGEIDRAEQMLARVLDVDRRYGRTVNLARDAFVQSRIDRARGEHEEAFGHAAAAMEQFEGLGMLDDLVRAGLIAVYSLVACNSHRRAMDLCQRLIALSGALDELERKTRRPTLTAEVSAYMSEFARREPVTLDA